MLRARGLLVWSAGQEALKLVQCMESERMVQIAVVAGAACLTIGLLRRLQGRSLELKQAEGTGCAETW